MGKAARPRYRFFTDAEADLLIDICEQIIPRDDVPGATDTGAINYIDRQLCGFLSCHQRAYRRGLKSFRQTCLKTRGAHFKDLAPAAKIEVLRSIELGEAPKGLWGDPSARAFFNLVLAHTMQSFYGSPRHGGNRDYASYRMLGLDYPQVVGQNRYGKALPWTSST
jgi:gluconate 2-dehydrogenase gamma chain